MSKIKSTLTALLLTTPACASGAAAQPQPGATPSATVGAWGSPVIDNDELRRCVAFLIAVAARDDGALATVGDPLYVGPALWSGLTSLDSPDTTAPLGELGTHTVAHITIGDSLAAWPMRSFIAEARGELLATLSFRAMSDAFAEGRARPATEGEREAFYSLIPFEIEGEPVTIVENDGQRLVIFMSKGRVTWIDLLSGYQTSPS